MNDSLGKDAEKKIKEWLDCPEAGCSFDRIKDQMTGFYGSKNICDFTLFKSPYMYYIESKATWEDRFDFVNISETQHDGLLDKSKIDSVYGVIIITFASHKRVVMIDINEIKRLEDNGVKSLNIKKIDKWGIRYSELQLIPNNRKKLLDITGDIEIYRKEIVCDETSD